MASHLGVSSRSTVPAAQILHQGDGRRNESPSLAFLSVPENRRNWRASKGLRIKVTGGGNDSYLDMWKNAVDWKKKEAEFQTIAGNLGKDAESGGDGKDGKREVDLEKKSEEFQKILEVPKEERDRVQQMQVIDRAEAAISAARAIISAPNSVEKKEGFPDENRDKGGTIETRQNGMRSRTIYVPRSEISGTGIPGPDFWAWTPPQRRVKISDENGGFQAAIEPNGSPASFNPIMEKERSEDFLSIPFESKLSENRRSFVLPPFQSLIEVKKKTASESGVETPSSSSKPDREILSSAHAAEVAHALEKLDESSAYGVTVDGSEWWKQTGVERRPDGVICRWTMTRGVSADGAVEWQDKYWEAADEFGYKELGSEKSGRDAAGNVWREFWKESMLQEHGVLHFEKTADKWGKNGDGAEWQEKWWEHYDASGKTEKWAHKWCSIDPNTKLEAGHAHAWHERWGEKYDGQGGSEKYSDKWAEKCEGDGWSKWGDKWDEHFDSNSHGVKQGETWWEGKHGERWNRTWGEQHNGSGWVHKYGKSSSGEHWDTHVQQETWYERFPHYGFHHCFDNSVQLRAVRKPSETS